MKIEFDKRESLAIIELVADHLHGKRDAMSHLRETMTSTVLPLVEHLGASSSPFGLRFGRMAPTEPSEGFSIDKVLADLPSPEDYGGLAQEHDQTLREQGMWALRRIFTRLPLDVRRAVREGESEVVHDLPVPGEKVDQALDAVRDTLASYQEKLQLKGLHIELKHHYTEGFDRSLVVSFTGPVELTPEGSRASDEGSGGDEDPDDQPQVDPT